MARFPRALVVGLALCLAPAIAYPQMFEGLDLGGKKKKKKKPPEEGTSNPLPKEKEPKSNEVKIPEGGIDLTKPPPTAPTMKFEEVDVSGKAADRQRLD